MANDVSGRPWRFDTARAYGTAGAVQWPAEAKIEHMEWTGYTAQGQKAIVKDQTGRVIWSPTGAADLSEVRSAKISWINGIIIDQLDAGVVTVYID